MHVLDPWQDKSVPFMQHFCWKPISIETAACSDAQYLSLPLLLQLQGVEALTNYQQQCHVLCRTWPPSKALNRAMAFRILRWHGRHSAEVNENIKMGYSQDQGYP